MKGPRYKYLIYYQGKLKKIFYSINAISKYLSKSAGTISNIIHQSKNYKGKWKIKRQNNTQKKQPISYSKRLQYKKKYLNLPGVIFNEELILGPIE
jgi:hypothetical protein